MPERSPSSHSCCFTNRFGKTYFIRKKHGRAPREYVATTSPHKALKKIPSGYEVREGINGHISICRIRPRHISIEEEQLVKAALSNVRPHAHRALVRDRAITIFASALDWKTYAETLDAEFATGFAAAVEETLARKFGRELANMFRAKRQARDSGEMPRRYYPLLQFELADPSSRMFKVKRIYFSGEKDWLALETLSLPGALMKYLPHLGRDSFFSLLGNKGDGLANRRTRVLE